MFTKLPRWVEVGGFWLASIAGAVNAIGLLGFKHQAVSHLTGTSTLLGLSLVSQDTAEMFHLLLILASFVAGAAASGLLIDREALRLGHRYGVALLLESALLFASMWALGKGSNTGHFLASAACGLQNGMVTTYTGATIRTTHVSGLFTDLGTMIGHRMRGHPLDVRRAFLYLLLITGFVFGGTWGAFAFARMEFFALAIPATAAGSLALVYWVYSRWYRSRGPRGPG